MVPNAGQCVGGDVRSRQVELFYWITITFSQTLGTALGDWTADDTGLGYLGGAELFGAALLVLALAAWWTKIHAPRCSGQRSF